MTVKRRAFAERREIVGHSQEALAETVGVKPTTVGRWERGETWPQPWCRPKLADALAVSVEELEAMLTEGQPVEDGRSHSSERRDDGEPLPAEAAEELPIDLEHDPVLTPPWNHRGTVEAAVALRGGDERVKRRVFVCLSGPALTAPAHQWLVREPGPLVSGLSGRRVSAGLVDRFLAMLPELRKMEDLAGGGSVLALARHEFGWVAGLLDQASYDERTGRALHVVLAELGQFCGWSACDAGDRGLAQRFYIAALRAAHSAGDRPLGAYILTCMASQAARHDGRPADAVTLIETALAGTRGRQTPALLAQLHMRHAYAFVSLRDTSACAAAISQARTQVEQLTPDDEPPWLYWVDPAQIMGNAGVCLLRLGQPDHAVTMLTDGIAQLDESFLRDRQFYLTHLASAHTRPGKQRDLHIAAGLGMESIDLAEGLDSATGPGLRDLYHELKPHAKVPAVRDFLERARGLATDQSPSVTAVTS
ncbi:MAG: helix-turn-helix domain-containing protein [Pseudonocardiaceae bacterium]